MGDNRWVNAADLGLEHGARAGSTRPPITSFRARRGALTPTQQQAWDRMWPRIGADAGGASHSDPYATPEPIDAPVWFGREAPLIAEIGCGTGTATAAMAQAEPHVNLLAIEVYRPGLAQLVQQIERENIPNIRLLRGDAAQIFQHQLAPESLTGVRVFFPDPWPKSRHHKRRLLQAPIIALITDRLQPGGVLHVATDHAGYAEAIAEAGDAEPRLRRLDWNTLGEREVLITHLRPVTKFEGKAKRAGTPVTELIWEKTRA